MSLPPGCEPACRGCYHRDIPLDKSLAQKTAWLKKILKPWEDKILDFSYVPWDDQLAYRDKVSLNAVFEEGRWCFGLPRKQRVIRIPDCPVHAPLINENMKVLTRYLPGPEELPLAFYVQSGKQLILVVRAAGLEGFHWPEPLLRELMALGNEGIWLHLNPEAGEKVLSRYQWHLLYGKPRSMSPLKLIYGPMSYQQVIPSLYIKAIQICQSFFDFSPGDGIADLYCGTGGSLVAWTRAGAQGIGVDINGEAVECARMNVMGTLVLRGKCADRLSQIDEWIQYKQISRFLVYTNPPKTGMEEETLHWLMHTSRPVRMAYMSCSASTMAADLKQLSDHDYRVVSVYPFDSYPRTHHVECLALLER